MTHQKQNWFLDLALLVGFLVCFFIDLTGIGLHQWLGLVVSVLAFAHLCLHWDWVKAVFSRFFGKASSRSRVYGLIDLSLFIGMFLILETGLLTSTWLNLNLSGFSTLLDVHLWSSIATLVILMAKLGLHWRWIITVAQKVFTAAPSALLQTGRLVPARVQQPQSVNRRQFLWMMGLVTGASALAVSNVLAGTQTAAGASEETADSSQIVQPEASAAAENGTNALESTDVLNVQENSQLSSTLTNEPAATTTAAAAAATAEPTMAVIATSVPAASSCSIRCGKKCSYPGRCRRYTDSNANGRCDLGECI